MNTLRSTILIHTAAWAPGLFLLFRILTDQLTADPIQDVTLQTGKYALILLMASLSMTPLKNLSGWSWTMTARKWFGVYAFFYALAHFLIYIGLDYGFAWVYILPEVVQKPYLMVGSLAFLILNLLAITSFRWWMDRLGRVWTHLHRLVYGAGLLVVLHFAWVRKGDLFSLQGDMAEPFLYGIGFLALMVLRIPAIRRKLSLQRKKGQNLNQTDPGQRVVRRIQRPNAGVKSE
jgi:sulfoxide reductase heme-binding subunit YedZ